MSVVRPVSTAPATDVDLGALAELVAKTFGCALEATPMPGGASTRRYFRVTLDGARAASASPKTAVAMFVPEGAKAEEVQKAHDGTRWPFLEVRDLLAEHGVEVPRVLAEDTDRGWLVIDDLGDATLANWLLDRPADKPALYTKAVTDLARAQAELAELPAGSVVRSRTFDFDLLRWEIEHFREWGLDARGKPLAESDAGAWTAIADRLARRVAELPQGFVHRDYQSRNLMVVELGNASGASVPEGELEGARPRAPSNETRLVWIDFQDALLGPRVYDLVALLNDSYQEFDRAFVEARLGDYATAAGLGADERERLVFEFDLVTVQRKLKDAGRFVFIDRKKNNPSFLKFVGPTIKKVGGALARLSRHTPDEPDMRDLLDILRRTLGDEI